MTKRISNKKQTKNKITLITTTSAHLRQESEYIWETCKTKNMVYGRIADDLH